ncbi:SAM-dependent methyltransferase HcgC family protein [uncultured Methanospirillum sp.]|uniref:SAM-dependent methyltransferase HcgC family protein n=1 Tax=uncultured Methanospirillum sp. TaxID=262503 RepID=UPI0029C80951|nr:SAM-dependent methyltransferase HcgC family protein [uncultured Methanospirillum sp.]
MIDPFRYEDGITPTVKTFFSQYLLQDLLDQITLKKALAVLKWLESTGPMPKACLICGAYLTGARLANTLARTASVTVLDQFPLVKNLLDPGVAYTTSIDDLPTGGWDLIMDTTGLGGIDPLMLRRFETPPIFVAEDPCSDGSDAVILQANQCYKLIGSMASERKGVLCTGGLSTKTSGTMTLMVEIMRRSMEDATRLEGVLYSTGSWEHFERLLFKEQNYEEFRKKLQRSALIVSSLMPVNPDEVIQTHVSALSSTITDFSEFRP